MCSWAEGLGSGLAVSLAKGKLTFIVIKGRGPEGFRVRPWSEAQGRAPLYTVPPSLEHPEMALCRDDGA